MKRIAVKNFKWKDGETYTVEIKMTSKLVDGSVKDSNGKQVAHIAYKLNAILQKSECGEWQLTLRI